MEQFFTVLKKGKLICIITLICILAIVFGGYLYYQQVQKQKLLESMNIIFKRVTEIEYGTKEFDVQKELVKEVKNAKIKTIPKINTNKIGKQTLKFTLVKDGLKKEVTHTLKIKDTQAPIIKFKEDSKELTVGDKFDIVSNIERVIDTVDGDIAFHGDALEFNKKATEEYNKLKKKDIKKNTKIIGKSLNDFLIEDVKDKDEKILYLKNCYYIDGVVDTGLAGEYIVTLVAVDKNGIKSEKEFKVTVKEIEVTQSQTYSNSNDNNSVDNNAAASNEISNNYASIHKGNAQDIINTAIAQVGKPYVHGGRGPESFDCEGLVRFAYAQNGYNIGLARSAGYSIGSDWTKAQPGDIIVQDNHVALVVSLDTSQVDKGYGYYLTIVEAKNPTMGIKQTMMNLSPEQTMGILDIRRVL